MMAQIFPDLKLHAVYLSKESRRRPMEVRRVCLNLPKVGDLLLEPGYSIQGHSQLFVIRYHYDSPIISTIPRSPPSRFTCQYSTAASSPPSAPSLRNQNTLAPKKVAAAPWSNNNRASPMSAAE